MLDGLQLLDELILLAQDKPDGLQGVSRGIWDDLIALIKKAVDAVVSNLLTPIKTGIGNIIKDIEDVVDDTISGIKKWLKPITDDIKTAISGVISDVKAAISNAISDIVEGVTTAFDNALGWLEDAITWIKSKIQDIINGISNLASKIIDPIKSFIQDKISDVSNWLTNVKDTIVTKMGEFASDIGDWIANLIQGVKDWLATVVSSISEWIGGIYSDITDWFDGLIQSLKEAYETVKETVEKKIQGIIDWLTTVWKGFQAFINANVKTFLVWFGKNVLPKIEDLSIAAQQVIDIAEGVWKLIQGGEYDKAFSTIDKFLGGIGLPTPVKILHSFLSAIAYFWLSIRLQFVPLEVAAQKKAIINLALEPISPNDAALALFRGEANESEFYNNAALAGVSKQRAKMALEATRALPTPGSIQEGYLRGEISEQEHDNLLKGYGYTKQDIDLFKALYMLIPTPGDLIRMAVREVFTPEIVQKFGQNEDFPKAFADWGKKIGLSEAWSKAYWAAHWDLPSPQMGFEMLHRGVIDNEELKLLMRALDIMPYWRERLIKISYSPLTRVDVRRMYQFGVLSEAQVKRAYLDLGYDNEKAGWLTEFTKRYSAPEDESELNEFRAMARATYSQAYKRRIIAKEEYREFLRSMRYHDQDIELLISLDDYAIQQNEKLFDLQDYRKDFRKLSLAAYDSGLLSRNEVNEILLDLGYESNEVALEFSLLDYNRQLKLRDILVAQLHDQYVNYIIDITQLSVIIGMFGFTDMEIQRLEEEWNIERSFRTRQPPLSDLRRFFEGGLITLQEFLNELRGIGYHEKYISLYEQMLTVVE